MSFCVNLHPNLGFLCLQCSVTPMVDQTIGSPRVRGSFLLQKRMVWLGQHAFGQTGQQESWSWHRPIEVPNNEAHRPRLSAPPTLQSRGIWMEDHADQGGPSTASGPKGVSVETSLVEKLWWFGHRVVCQISTFWWERGAVRRRTKLGSVMLDSAVGLLGSSAPHLRGCGFLASHLLVADHSGLGSLHLVRARSHANEERITRNQQHPALQSKTENAIQGLILKLSYAPSKT